MFRISCQFRTAKGLFRPKVFPTHVLLREDCLGRRLRRHLLSVDRESNSRPGVAVSHGDRGGVFCVDYAVRGGELLLACQGDKRRRRTRVVDDMHGGGVFVGERRLLLNERLARVFDRGRLQVLRSHHRRRRRHLYALGFLNGHRRARQSHSQRNRGQDGQENNGYHEPFPHAESLLLVRLLPW